MRPESSPRAAGRASDVRMSAIVVVAVVVVAGAAGTAGVAGMIGTGDDSATASGADKTSDATATVTRGDLVETTSASGAVEYAGARELDNGLTGTVTWLPRSGRVIRQGKTLYEVDQTPVVRLDGTVPAWRDLAADVTDGRDVRQLEEALDAMGYPEYYDMEVDSDWTWVTTIAVQEWIAIDRTASEQMRPQVGVSSGRPGRRVRSICWTSGTAIWL